MGRILVTGGAGFIGSHVIDRLVAAGNDAVVLDDLSSGSERNLARHASRVPLLIGRVEEIGTMRDELQGVDTVVHLAALISGHDSLLQPREYLDANVGGLLTLLETMRAIGARRVVLASSATVYGDSGTVARSESDVPLPITTYALTKLAGEHLLRMYGPLWGFTHTSLRLFNVYGPRQNPSHPYANVTCKFAHAAALGLPVPLYGDGEQSRDFVYVDDVVEVLVRAIQPTPRPIYNVGTGVATSIRDLLATVERVSGRKLDVTRMPPWPNDVRSVRADVELLARDLDFRPRTSLEHGLRATYESFLPPTAV